MAPNQEQIDQFLQPLAECIGARSLEFDDRGICALSVDDKFTIVVELDDGDEVVHLHTSLGVAPDEPLERLACFSVLLDANLFGVGTHGASLACSVETGEMVLCRVVRLDNATVGGVMGDFERFVAASRAWQDWIAERRWESSARERDGAGKPRDPAATYLKA